MNETEQLIIDKYQDLKNENYFEKISTQLYGELAKFKEEYNVDFYEQYGIESLKKYSGKELLNLLFAPEDNNKIGLSKVFEYKTRSWGLFNHVDYKKNPVAFCTKGENSAKTWRTKNGREITETEAIDIAENVKLKILELNNYLINNEFVEFANAFPNEYYRFYHKYFYMLYPEYLTSYHQKDFAPNIKNKLGVDLSKKLGLEIYFSNLIKNSQFSDMKVDDLRMTAEVLWGVGVSKNTYKETNNKGKDMNESSLNQILYGPPGTGKTYNTIIEAIKIIDKDIIEYDNDGNCENYSDVKDKFDKLKDEGQIQFVTFHQSYSYEEFIEGIKPKTENGQITYEVQDGIFKKMCDNAQKQVIDNFDEVYEQFINEVIEYEDENSKPFTLKTSKNRIFGIKVNSNNNLTLLMGENLSPYGTLTKENLKNLADWKYYAAPIKEYLAKKYDLKYKQIENSNNKPYVLIIDEINRGNISKIFGELITLIEDDKRLGNDNKLMVQLPYSQKPFGVPKNLYIIGTMNTSDRSIALLDTALRRRFDFIEMPPKPELLKDKKVEGVDINFEKLLNEINSQIDDKDRKIGHSYLINIKNENDLKRAFKNKIIPLLEEYYYSDKEQINSILTCGDEIKKTMEIVNK